MATTLNADTSTGGLIATGDGSGDLELQANGTTKISVTSSGAAVTGLNATGMQANGLTYPTSDGTANQVLVTNGSGTLSFADAASGAWSLVSEVTVSSTVSSVDLEGMDSTYRNYCVMVSDGTLDSGENIYLRFKNGGSYDTSSIYSNIEAGMRSSNNVWNLYQKENLSAMEWMNMTSAATGHQGVLYIFNPSHTTSRTSIIGHWTVGDSNGSYYSTYSGLYNKTSSAAVTGVRFYPNNRNWTGGNFRLYGIGG